MMQGTQPQPVKDPVCGMDVDPVTAEHTSEHQGQTYFFCSLMCKRAFEDQPQHYLSYADPAVGER